MHFLLHKTHIEIRMSSLKMSTIRVDVMHKMCLLKLQSLKLIIKPHSIVHLDMTKTSEGVVAQIIGIIRGGWGRLVVKFTVYNPSNETMSRFEREATEGLLRRLCLITNNIMEFLSE